VRLNWETEFALFNLGVAYNTGMGVAKDQVEAIKLFKRSAELGFVEAQFNLGVAYKKGMESIKTRLRL
jgi:uncharacterized protein